MVGIEKSDWFMPRKSTIETILSIRYIMNKYRENKAILYIYMAKRIGTEKF